MMKNILGKVEEIVTWCFKIIPWLLYFLSFFLFQPLYCLVTVGMALYVIAELLIVAYFSGKWFLLADITIFVLCAVYWYFNIELESQPIWNAFDDGYWLLGVEWFHCWRAYWIGWFSVCTAVTAMFGIIIFSFVMEFIIDRKRK